MKCRVRLITLAVAACAGGEAPAPEPGTPQTPVLTGRTLALSLPEGTSLQVVTSAGISSGADKMGEMVRATVIGGARDASGRTVIPSGSFVTLRIDEISGATTVQPNGVIRLSVVSVQVQQQELPLKAQIDSVPSRLIDRLLLVERATLLTLRLTSSYVANVQQP